MKLQPNLFPGSRNSYLEKSHGLYSSGVRGRAGLREGALAEGIVILERREDVDVDNSESRNFVAGH
jgi:hypothetical protein